MKYFLWYVLAAVLAAGILDPGPGTSYHPPVACEWIRGAYPPQPENPELRDYKGRIVCGSDPMIDYP